MKLRPSEIRFSKDSISNVFDKKSYHADIHIGETLDALLKGECDISDIPTITVVNRNGTWYSADNRRLWVFRKLEEFGKCSDIPVESGRTIPLRKLTTQNDGKDIRVRRNPGGCYWRRPVDDRLSDDDQTSDCNQSKEDNYLISSYGKYPSSDEENDFLSDDENYLDGYTCTTVQDGYMIASRTFTTVNGATSGLARHDETGSDSYRCSTSFETQKAYLISTSRGCKQPVASGLLFKSSVSQTHTFFKSILSESHSLTIEPLDPEKSRNTKNTFKAPHAGSSSNFSKSILVCRADNEHMALEGNGRVWFIPNARQCKPIVGIPTNVKDKNNQYNREPWYKYKQYHHQYTTKHYYKRRWNKKRYDKHQHSKNLHLQYMYYMNEELYDDDQYYEDLFIDDLYNEDFFPYEDLCMKDERDKESIKSYFDDSHGDSYGYSSDEYSYQYSSDEYSYGYDCDEYDYGYMNGDSDEDYPSFFNVW